MEMGEQRERMKGNSKSKRGRPPNSTCQRTERERNQDEGNFLLWHLEHDEKGRRDKRQICARGPN